MFNEKRDKKSRRGGGNASPLGRVDRWLFLVAKQLGSEAAKRNCHCEAKSFKEIIEIFEYPLSQSHSIKREFVKFLSLLTKWKLFIFSPLGERLEFVSELEQTYKFKRGVQRHKNTDRATECAMTGVGKVSKNNFLQQKQPSCLAALSSAASPDMNHSPLTTHHSPKRKVAFTLAEVLITLGIIGVVAALTLPMVIKNYQYKQKSVALKKAYSTLEQAIIMSQQEHGDSSEWERFPYHRDGSLKWANEYIFKYVKKVTACEDDNWAVKCPTTLNKICNPNGSCHGVGARTAIYILADGENIYLYGGGNPDANMTTDYIHVLVDTNGINPPNQYGKDVFTFTISLGSSKPLGVFGGWAESGVRPILLRTCKQTPEKCVALLKYDNWEFKKDYPW